MDEPSAGGGADDCDHPPELTARDCGRPGGVSSRAIAAVDLEWLSALAKEHNVVYEEPAAEDDDVCEAAGEKDAAGGGARANTGMIGGAHRGKIFGLPSVAPMNASTLNGLAKRCYLQSIAERKEECRSGKSHAWREGRGKGKGKRMPKKLRRKAEALGNRGSAVPLGVVQRPEL